MISTIDGHQMARQGRAGIALGLAAIGSFIAGTLATLLIAALASPLTALALLFGPAEYFSLMVLGLTFAMVLARGSVLKAASMVILGVLLSTIGTDLETGEERLTFGLSALSDGIDFTVLAMGLFGFAEILRNLENPEARAILTTEIGRLLPSRDDLRKAIAQRLPACLRRTDDGIAERGARVRELQVAAHVVVVADRVDEGRHREPGPKPIAHAAQGVESIHMVALVEDQTLLASHLRRHVDDVEHPNLVGHAELANPLALLRLEVPDMRGVGQKEPVLIEAAVPQQRAQKAVVGDVPPHHAHCLGRHHVIVETCPNLHGHLSRPSGRPARL